MFDKEAKFEEALVQLLLKEKGWNEVLNNPTEQDLIQNWAKTRLSALYFVHLRKQKLWS